jgi:hypothetical protein
MPRSVNTEGSGKGERKSLEKSLSMTEMKTETEIKTKSGVDVYIKNKHINEHKSSEEHKR